MIIVAGRLTIRSGKRQEFLDSSRPAMIQARSTPGCSDFVVSADPIDSDRVNIYEVWETQGQLLQFRGSGPDDVLGDLIVDASVMEHEIES